MVLVVAMIVAVVMAMLASQRQRYKEADASLQ
jgi:hypothetical protein